MKIAKFKNIEFSTDYETVSNNDMSEYSATYIRTSQWIEVEFPPLSDESVIQSHLDALQTAENNLYAAFKQKVDQIQEQRSKLLALTYKPDTRPTAAEASAA